MKWERLKFHSYFLNLSLTLKSFRFLEGCKVTGCYATFDLKIIQSAVTKNTGKN
nr:hypothetical protein GZ9E5_12 [uncultured archaeon GZfos9E5]